MKNIMVTGGAGFIGSNLIKYLLDKCCDYRILNVDLLTYAGNLGNLMDIENNPRYSFLKADICDYETMLGAMRDHNIDGIIHLAAESHVDRSIEAPLDFVRTNVMGTATLLSAARAWWESLPDKYEGKMFHHVSTDEVYGSLMPDDAPFTESTPYAPHSPYSAAKASSDHFVRAYHDTYGMPAIITNCSNNYGPYQFPEKLIPLVINNVRLQKPVPVYGTGENVRDWLYVEDHARAIELIFREGKPGSTYNIGGSNEKANIDLIKRVIDTADNLLGNPEGYSHHLITFVTDRKGHDLRYAIDSSKLKTELGWEPATDFNKGIEKTVEWYLNNTDWLEEVTSGAYTDYYEKMYGHR
ncbi:MAG: dTDP-glucose 4,6-dehydratase [Paramuribaculum sp.]|nr:dTDP-glucose 4,6-dehydratase [Bacteroides sp.]MDE6826835.1 dTDP-glucose 4,6-dehydratase [Paramuribaculum sp.]